MGNQLQTTLINKCTNSSQLSPLLPSRLQLVLLTTATVASPTTIPPTPPTTLLPMITPLTLPTTPMVTSPTLITPPSLVQKTLTALLAGFLAVTLESIQALR